MRASLGTTGVAWAVLAGLAAVFAQLTQAQPSMQQETVAAHPVIQWAYWVFDGALGVSVAAVLIGGVPLWWAMMRAARGRSRGWLLAPVLGAVGATSVVDVANGAVGPWWFLVLVVLGFVAAGVSAAGPGVALRLLRPDGARVRLAARACGVAAASMGVAAAASVAAAIGLYRWAPGYAGYHQAWQLAVYLPPVVLAAAVAMVSAARGVWAGRSEAAAR
jgi:hypothetical protein